MAATVLFSVLRWIYGKEHEPPMERDRPVWAIPTLAASCLVLSHVMNGSELAEVSLVVGTVFVALGEELVFRFAPFVLLAHCKRLWRNMTTAIFGIIVFVAVHMPSLDILFIDKLFFAVAATALVVVSGGIWLAVSLHVSSNLLWHAMVVIGQQGHLSYFVADLVLVTAALIVALRLHVRKGLSIGVSV
jgi:membrane protease YdiL (CAAX protease family)